MFGFGPLGETASLSNIWSHGGVFPHGMAGPLLALQVVVFAFVGVELLGVTAGESKDPEKTLPTAVRRVIWRIGLFYLGALTAVMALVPWNQLDPHVSPFVLVFAKVGIPAAAAVVNTVVLTAALSSCNSGVFSTGRMLHTLARDRHAPAAFGKVSGQGVPAAGILASMAVMLLGVAANYFVPEKAFAYVTSVATVAAVFTWGIISSAHLRFRAAVRAGRLRPVAFRMPLAPVSNYFVLAFLSYTQPHHARRVRPALAPPPTTPPSRIAVRPLRGAGHRGPTDGGRAPGRRSGGVLGGCWRRSHKSPAGSGHCSAGHLLAPIP
ncbi:amino acid permease [Streptomyces platensis]|uniref:amino acid permease n=1 Tax=Streptomyces platensis TaxID=58346 RepID=UPI003F4CCDB2